MFFIWNSTMFFIWDSYGCLLTVIRHHPIHSLGTAHHRQFTVLHWICKCPDMLIILDSNPRPSPNFFFSVVSYGSLNLVSLFRCQLFLYSVKKKIHWCHSYFGLVLLRITLNSWSFSLFLGLVQLLSCILL